MYSLVPIFTDLFNSFKPGSPVGKCFQVQSSIWSQKKRVTKEYLEKRSRVRNGESRLQVQLQEDGVRQKWMEKLVCDLCSTGNDNVSKVTYQQTTLLQARTSAYQQATDLTPNKFWTGK